MNDISPTSAFIKNISRLLGREIKPSEKGSIESFEEFSESDLRDFKVLEQQNGATVISYICFRLKHKTSLRTVVSYYDSVIQRGFPVTCWSTPAL